MTLSKDSALNSKAKMTLNQVELKEETPFRAVVSRRYYFGMGINDVKDCSYNTRAYVSWRNMLERCYAPYAKDKYPTYNGSTVCEEWLRFSNFKKWFDERFVEKSGQELDKDILAKGNKCYSPETCCLVPHRINTLILKSEGKRGELPIGVSRGSWNNLKDYSSAINIYDRCVFLGGFDTPEEAFQAYKRVKEAYIALEANIAYSRGFIDKRTLNALLNYKIEITD